MSRLGVVACLAVMLPLGCSIIVSTDGLSGGDTSDASGNADARADATPFMGDASTIDAPGDAPGGGCARLRVSMTCSGPYEPAYDPAGKTGAAASSTQATEVVVLGMYEPASSSVAVVDRRAEPHVLFLTSYSTTSWQVTTTTPGALRRIIVSGYDRSTVAAPDGVTVDNLGPRTPYADGPGEKDVADLVVAKTGSPWTAFAGCYRASSYELSDDCP